MRRKNFNHSAARCLRWVAVMTSPVAMSMAANRVVVPCRTQS